MSSSKVLDSPGNKTYAKGLSVLEDDMFLFLKAGYVSFKEGLLHFFSVYNCL